MTFQKKLIAITSVFLMLGGWLSLPIKTRGQTSIDFIVDHDSPTNTPTTTVTATVTIVATPSPTSPIATGSATATILSTNLPNTAHYQPTIFILTAGLIFVVAAIGSLTKKTV